MPSQNNVESRVLSDPIEFTKSRSELENFQYKFRSTKWVYYAFAFLILTSCLASNSIQDAVCAVIIEVAAFYSVLVWAKRKVLGMPMMPIYAGLCVIYYGLPFVSGHPAVQEFNFDEKLFAATTVAVVLLIMTVVWSLIGRPRTAHPTLIRTLLVDNRAIRIMLVCLAGAIAFHSNVIAYVGAVPTEIYGVLRAILSTLGVLALFALSYLTGARALRASQKYLFFTMAVVLILLQLTSLYLVTMAQHLVAIGFGYFLGRGRLPWKAIAVSAVLLVILQAGKGDMRFKYWGDGDANKGSTSTLSLVGDWLRTGIGIMMGEESLREDTAVPLLERTSLVQMLLKTQTEAPETVPYLYGDTYLPIPLLLIPRIVWPGRPTTSDTLIELNISYGLLTRESAENVSIGWGMISEANANFGFLGCIGFALVMGSLLGIAQRQFGRFPLLSARGMAGLLVMFVLLAMESSMAQFVTTIAQSLVPLLLLSYTIMQPRRITI